MEQAREKRWQAFREIAARNDEKDPDEVEHDVAEVIDEVRREQGVETAATHKT